LLSVDVEVKTKVELCSLKACVEYSTCLCLIRPIIVVIKWVLN